MKNVFRVMAVALMATLITGSGLGTLQSASAAERSDGADPGQENCRAVLVGGGNSSGLKGKETGSTKLWLTSNSNISVNDRTVDVDVKVTDRNGKNCKDTRVALTAWKAPRINEEGNAPINSNPTPEWITTQTMYSMDAENMKPGQVHTLSTQLPCDSKWQVDAFVINDSATLPQKGSSFMDVHGKKNANGVNEFKNMGAATGETKCTQPKPEPKSVEVCDTDTGQTMTVPENKADNEQYADVNDEACEPVATTPEEPTPEEPEEVETVQKEAPEEIPATGPASIIAGILGSGALAGGATSYLRSKRNLNSAL